ncbi:MAG TPA: NADH-ubiquinone oxidoreductase-F iron-sulfur binding region domain-containing protein [Bacteroidota bacterium]|nr:NADH-ubiquinone oxidoreductase-F iron-sulfur binding region domain-containing protein [Bacteroidota bacterium]
MKTLDAAALADLRKKSLKKLFPEVPKIFVGMGTCGMGNGAKDVFEALDRTIKSANAAIQLSMTGCFGFCAEETLVNCYIPGLPLVVLHKVTPKDADNIVQCLSKGIMPLKKALCKIERWDFFTSKMEFGTGLVSVPHWNELPFFKGQKKIVLRESGLIDPENIEDYFAVGGYSALFRALTEMTPETVLEEIKQSKLRGRGGAGFPTAIKWEMMKNVATDKKYIICNADEGDPGAYMNRNEIESDPHSLIEGMLIGAYVMGASEGIMYVRAEYPLAVERFRKAVAAAKKFGILGEKIFGSAFSFELSYVEGAGAFVCGEETALIVSIEGKAGRPVPRPPYPAQKGLWGKPTNINNVETWFNIPVILTIGGNEFAKFGTQTSTGTKVFSLVGKVKNTGLVELPLGTPLQNIIYQMGEGTGNKKRIRAVQTGGPSGGCIPVEYFNTPVDYESLTKLGTIMGSGGMVVMDQDNCMVDVARYFVEVTSKESCGKCTPCREGLAQALSLLNKITRGEATMDDLDRLERLSYVIRDSSLCGLGQTSSNPVLTTLRYFRDEYERHIIDKRCKAGVCESLFVALCENSCPLHMNIPGYLQLLKENRIEEAFELTLRDNPLPGTVGRICYFHCQMRCRRDMVDEPVNQGEIHRYLADIMYKMGREKVIYDRLIREKLSPTGKQISIVGAGPAGLTAAYYLVRLGHSVTVYDAHPKAGGILQYGIPAYRLPKDGLNKELELFRKLGVKFVFNTRIGGEVTVKGLAKSSDAVFIAIGAQKDIELDIPGRQLSGVLNGYEFLEEFALGKKLPIGKKVVVVGAGNVAIDAARSCLRLGAEVTIVYRRDRDEMPANAHEIQDAIDERINFMFLSAPARILGDLNGKVTGLEIHQMKLDGVDAMGRKKPIDTGQSAVVECSTVILAIGEKVDLPQAQENGIDLRPNGTIKVTPASFRTSLPKVYAGGDAVTGPATVAEAMGIARRAAEAIDHALMKEKRFHRLFRDFQYKDEIAPAPEEVPKIDPKKISVKERVSSFQEVLAGFTGEEALLEATRCLRCDVKCHEELGQGDSND